MSEYYDRYEKLKVQGVVPSCIPFIPIPRSEGDIYVNYDRSKMRMDVLAYKYYGDPNLGWLILQANPEVGGFEFSIEDGTLLRIPYPKDSALNRYEDECNKVLNGKIL